MRWPSSPAITSRRSSSMPSPRWPCTWAENAPARSDPTSIGFRFTRAWPAPRRCYEWGRALGEILGSRPERVALIASGGMSHYPGTDRYASPDFDWDRRVLETLQAGRGSELAAVTGEELDKTGNIELRTWITLLGAVGDRPADVYCYEPSWHHGNAVVEWRV